MTSILVVEDDETLRETIALNLRAEGYEVVTAGEGDLGLSSAREIEPDLVVLDVIFTRPKDERTEDYVNGRFG